MHVCMCTSTVHIHVEMRRLFRGVFSLFYFYLGVGEQAQLTGLVSQAPLAA